MDDCVFDLSDCEKAALTSRKRRCQRLLAMTCVETLDRFRAPPSEAELARRRANPLSAEQEAMLARWGYPYVGPGFRFHLTLSSALSPEDLEATAAALAPHVAPFRAAPLAVREVAQRACGVEIVSCHPSVMQLRTRVYRSTCVPGLPLRTGWDYSLPCRCNSSIDLLNCADTPVEPIVPRHPLQQHAISAETIHRASLVGGYSRFHSWNGAYVGAEGGLEHALDQLIKEDRKLASLRSQQTHTR